MLIEKKIMWHEKMTKKDVYVIESCALVSIMVKKSGMLRWHTF